MAKITRIKAGEAPAKEAPKEPAKPAKAASEPQKAAKSAKLAPKTAKSAPGATKSPEKKPFILFRPFIALALYLRDSWREIRQVRWPNRKATWQMFFAVIVYSALFVVLITLLDIFFSWIFNLILGK